MRLPIALCTILCGIFGTMQAAQAETDPAKEALIENQQSFKTPREAVQNRFFLKEERFEFSPIIGFVPNDPMVNRITGGLLVAYHFSESIAAEGAFIYSPDLGKADVKGLTSTLVQIAEQGSGKVEFQQPIDKLQLGATFAVRWSPVYGKISLIGEGILNFDVYGVAGIGMLSVNKFFVKSSGNYEDPIVLVPAKWEPIIPLNLGMGINFFLNQTVALKLDARSYIYQGPEPQYDPEIPVTESRLYNTLVTSLGASVFFPKMKPRMNY